ncbi:MAG: hypothetical protein WB564_06335 [Dehalococcoidia bacterium]
MAELFGITKGDKAKAISEFPFQDELNDLEPFIRENPKILGDSIEIFGEQVDTGAGDRIDLLALDKTAGTAQITLIELKKEIAEQTILLQTLRYANWIKNHPDSIKFLLEKKRLSTEKIDFNPKIVIVAPQIDPALLELSQYVESFEFDFVEVRRFGSKENCYLVTDHKAPPKSVITSVHPSEEWNWDKYETKLGISKDRIEIGKSLFDKVQAICETKQWSLVPRFRQYYIPFKYGGRNVFYISYWVSGQFCHLGFKLGKPPEQLNINDPYPSAEHKYYPDYGDYYVRIEGPNLDIGGYIPFMETAYRNVTKE